MPAFLVGHFLFPAWHDARDAFRDLPVELAVSHRSHAFLVRQVGRLAMQTWQVRFITGTSFAVTEDAITFRWIEVECLSFLNRLGRRRDWVLRLIRIVGKFPGVVREVRLRAATGNREKRKTLRRR